MTNYLLCGGGTGGHVNPMLALAEYIRLIEPSSKVLTLGTREGLESRLVPERGFELATIARLPFPRKLNAYAFGFPKNFLGAVRDVKKLIRDRQIDVVVGFGGYASAPAYLAAKQLKVPYVIHEANALPGMANRLGVKNAAAIGVAFGNTKLLNAQTTGMPLRVEIEKAIVGANQELARKKFGLNPGASTLVVTGGSLGAKSINEAIASAAGTLDAAGIQVLHITGDKSDLPEQKTKSLVRIKYCNEMDQAFAAADLIVARAGASTVCEIGAFGVPAIFVPYPVGNGEQKFNAEGLVAAGGAVMVEDKSFTAEYIRDQLVPMISNTKALKEMSVKSRKSSIANGTERLFKLVQSVLPTKQSQSK